MNDLYEELYLDPQAALDSFARILAKQRRDWTARSDTMPDEAARMLALIDEADVAFASEESRRTYDEALAASRAPAPEPNRDAQRQADYERFSQMAQDSYDTREFDLAEVAFQNALRNAPAEGAGLELCLLAARVYAALGKFDPAVSYQNQAMALDMGNPQLYLTKFDYAQQLGQQAPDDQRGTREALVNILRIAIRKAEQAGAQAAVGAACSLLADLLFTRQPGDTTEAEALALRAVAIDASLPGAKRVLDALAAQRAAEQARRAATEREEAAQLAEWERVAGLLRSAEEFMNGRPSDQQAAKDRFSQVTAAIARLVEREQALAAQRRTLGLFAREKKARIDAELAQLAAQRTKAEAEARAEANSPVVDWQAVQWQAIGLDEPNLRVLMITRDIIARMPFHQPYGRVWWPDCTLRRWLNGEFYNSLPAHIQARAVEAVMPAVTPGDNLTRDRVFLLSKDEAMRFFADDQARMATHNGQPGWWWLRSPGGDGYSAATVNLPGNVYANGIGVYHSDGGVRPALFLNLDA